MRVALIDVSAIKQRKGIALPTVVNITSRVTDNPATATISTANTLAISDQDHPTTVQGSGFVVRLARLLLVLSHRGFGPIPYRSNERTIRKSGETDAPAFAHMRRRSISYTRGSLALCKGARIRSV